jgi:hypothetical protein
VIEDRVRDVDPEELDDTIKEMQFILQEWEDWHPQKWEPEYNRDGSYGDRVPLIFSAGRQRNVVWGNRGFETPTSMRSVDAICEAEAIANRYSDVED